MMQRSQFIASLFAAATLPSCGPKEEKVVMRPIPLLPIITQKIYNKVANDIHSAGYHVSIPDSRWNPKTGNRLVIAIATKHSDEVEKVALEAGRFLLKSKPQGFPYSIILENYAGLPGSESQEHARNKLNEYRNRFNTGGGLQSKQLHDGLTHARNIKDVYYSQEFQGVTVCPGERNQSLNLRKNSLYTSTLTTKYLMLDPNANGPYSEFMNEIHPEHLILKVNNYPNPTLNDLFLTTKYYNDLGTFTGQPVNISLEHQGITKVIGPKNETLVIVPRSALKQLQETLYKELNASCPERNSVMFDVVRENLGYSVAVIDVGAAHMVGQGSIQELCSKEGIALITIDAITTAESRIK